jgi:hypothetical protein
MTRENSRLFLSLEVRNNPIRPNYQTTLNSLVLDERYINSVCRDQTGNNITFATAIQPTADDQIVALTPNGIFLFRLQPRQNPESFIRGEGNKLLKATATSPLTEYGHYGETAIFEQGNIKLEYTAYPLESDNLNNVRNFLTIIQRR